MFSTRNAYYLRVSNYKVIPLFVYLDERHVNWMSKDTLDAVVDDLQPKMKNLLMIDHRSQKKHKVHVDRGEGYQYCYFLRNTSKTEVVITKNKTLALDINAPDVKPDLDAEGNLKDYKPDYQVSYKGFGTSAHQLVVIVEPYPPLDPAEYAPPASRLSSRSTSVAYSRSRTGASRMYGSQASGSRASSVSLSVEPPSRSLRQASNAPNMRNASRSVSSTPIPNSRRGGSSTPLREASSTPGPGSSVHMSMRGPTPLFLPSDTPFDQDEEDEEAQQAYLEALREGRVRLPSVSRPAGMELSKTQRRSAKRQLELDEEGEDDEPESAETMGERIMRNGDVEERVVRVHGGWEERGEGEESAVLGKEEPGD